MQSKIDHIENARLSLVLGAVPLSLIIACFMTLGASIEALAIFLFAALSLSVLVLFFYSIKIIVSRRRDVGFLASFFAAWFIFFFLLEMLYVSLGTGGYSNFLASLVFIPLGLLTPAVAIALGISVLKSPSSILGIAGIICSIISGFVVSALIIIEIAGFLVKNVH
jgi:hypothetical protein